MTKPIAAPPAAPTRKGSPIEVFWAFLRLGLTSFGGPAAHVGYFRAEFVDRRRWLDDAAFAELVALCQFLPGPASSQTGIALGLMRAGGWGGVLAWAGFTLPSAALMILLGLGAPHLGGALAMGAIHGLKLAAVGVVAQAVWGMAKTLTPDRTRAALALIAAALAALLAGPGQIAALAIGALAGLALCKPGQSDLRLPDIRVPRAVAVAALIAFFGLLALSLTPGALPYQPVRSAEAFYRSGALVFGGGHVVLPLLQDQVVRPGWVSQERFLAGYAAAQALPGPLFTFAAYLGVQLQPGPNGLAGGLVALLAIFLPGALLLVGVLPFWRTLAGRASVRAGMMGANAAVVGVLGAALYNPVWTSAVIRPIDAVLAAAAFVALTVGRIAPVWVVAAATAVGMGMAAFA